MQSMILRFKHRIVNIYIYIQKYLLQTIIGHMSCVGQLAKTKPASASRVVAMQYTWASGFLSVLTAFRRGIPGERGQIWKLAWWLYVRLQVLPACLSHPRLSGLLLARP